MDPGLDNTPEESRLDVVKVQFGAKIRLDGTNVASNCDFAVATIPNLYYGRGHRAIIEMKVEVVAAFDKHFHNRCARGDREGAR